MNTQERIGIINNQVCTCMCILYLTNRFYVFFSCAQRTYRSNDLCLLVCFKFTRLKILLIVYNDVTNIRISGKFPHPKSLNLKPSRLLLLMADTNLPSVTILLLFLKFHVNGMVEYRVLYVVFFHLAESF